MASNEPYDEWENDDEGGAPAVSWSKSDVGDPSNDTVRGIIVPPNPIDEPFKGYALRIDSNKEGRRVWPPKSPWVYDPPAPINPKSPISEQEYLKITGGDDSDMRYVWLTVITIQTEYRNKEFFSGPQRKAALEDPEFVDDGLRRFFVDGKDIPPKFKDAVKKLRTKGPQPGQVFECQIIAREPNRDKEGETNRFRISLSPATPESMTVVAQHLAAAKAAVVDSNDPWAAAPVADAPAGQPEEVPF